MIREANTPLYTAYSIQLLEKDSTEIPCISKDDALERASKWIAKGYQVILLTHTSTMIIDDGR